MLPAVGLCRFSYPFLNGTGFKASSASLIYDSKRLEERLTLFEHVMLPSIRNQYDQDFSLGILLSDDLPRWCYERVVGACADIKQIKILNYPPNLIHRDVCSAAIRSLRPSGCKRIFEFRIDDDDAISVNFIRSVREILCGIDLEMLGPVLEIDFPCGYHLLIGDRISLAETTQSHLTCAQAWIVRGQSQKTMFNFHHFNFWRNGPCISMPHRAMYLRSIHRHNDTKVNLSAFQGAVDVELKYEDISRNFGILSESFGVLAKLAGH